MFLKSVYKLGKASNEMVYGWWFLAFLWILYPPPPTNTISMHNQASILYCLVGNIYLSRTCLQFCTHPQNQICLKEWWGISLRCNSGCCCVVTNIRNNCKLQAESTMTSFLLGMTCVVTYLLQKKKMSCKQHWLAVTVRNTAKTTWRLVFVIVQKVNHAMTKSWNEILFG